MVSNRGFSLLELVVVMGLIGVAAAITIPSFNAALERNRVHTSAELVASQIRSARLSAISRNQRFDVRFDCPAAGAVRVLEWTGNASIDNASDRCNTSQPNDGPLVYMAEGVTFGSVPTIQINGRGQVSPPLTITVSHDSITRTVQVTASGRISTSGS